MWLAHDMRKDGHTVNAVIGLRGHRDNLGDEHYMWRWLQWSWAAPGTMAPVIPSMPADSDPVLTVDALTKMTTFWTSFAQAPDTIRVAGRWANQKPISMSVGKAPASVLKTDMIAMAAKYPLIAADLKTAGLTAQQEEAYRAAIIRIEFVRLAKVRAADIADTSVLGQNMAFRNAHESEFQALSQTPILRTQ